MMTCPTFLTKRAAKNPGEFMKNKTRLFLCIVGMFLLATSCQQEITPENFDTACRLQNDKKHISVSGHLQRDTMMWCSNSSGSMRCDLKLHKTADDPKIIKVEVLMGTGKNHLVNPKKDKSGNPFTLKDQSGSLVTSSNLVAVVGKLRYLADSSDPNDSPTCWMEIDIVEKIAPQP